MLSYMQSRFHLFGMPLISYVYRPMTNSARYITVYPKAFAISNFASLLYSLVNQNLCFPSHLSVYYKSVVNCLHYFFRFTFVDNSNQ